MTALEAASTHPYARLWQSTDTNLQATEWAGETGLKWAERNPIDVDGTNKSWRDRFGIDKVSAIREAAFGVPWDAKWLEVGCSAGAHMRCMQAAGWLDVHGCDVNREAIEKADNATWADARELPFEDGQFDAVTTSGSLMHMGPEERMVDCLHEMCRVSKEWLFLIEIHQQAPTIMSFGDLLPPAWIMPWPQWLGAHLPKGWKGVRGRVMNSTKGAVPLVMLLIRKT
jgi:hypothetical protein